MMRSELRPKCPNPECGRRKSVVPWGDVWRCTACGTCFDDDPNEGGDYYSDPGKRAERQDKPIQRRR